MKTYMDFADKLSLLRAQKGYSQEQLAAQLSVSRQSVSKWESGVSLPETDKLIGLSRLLNVSIDFLLKDTLLKDDLNPSLDRTIFKFLGSAQQMDEISRQLVDIMQDGIIDDEEMVQLASIMQTLDNLVKIIDEIKLRVKI